MKVLIAVFITLVAVVHGETRRRFLKTKILHEKYDFVEIKVLDMYIEILDISIEVLDISIEVLDISIEALDISIVVLYISIEVLDISIEVLDIFIEVLDISIEVLDVSIEVLDMSQVEALGLPFQGATIVKKMLLSDFCLCSMVKRVFLCMLKCGWVVGVVFVYGLKYQVSWVEDAATAVSGERPIKLYDDQGYAALRKAQRGNEDTSTVQPIATINLYHPGAYRGPWVQSETMAIIAAIFVYYYALTQKTRLMA
nr:uncharacterized protein LOC128704924 [Cherax quadricarinatus]